MKIKRFLSILGLGLFAAVSAGAGLALAKDAKAEPVNADANTWMMRFELCLGSVSPHHDPVPWGDNYVESVRFHYWGTNVDEEVDASYMYFFTHDYYGVNVALTDSQTITGAQWEFHQHGIDDWKYSVDITDFGSDDVHQLNKDSTLAGIMWQVSDAITGSSGWEDGKWKLMSDKGYPTSYIQLEVGIGTPEYVNFVKEPSSNSFVVRNREFDNDSVSLAVESGGFELSDGFYMMDETSKQYIQGGEEAHPNWWYMKGSGTFDYILTSGGLKIRKHIEDYYSVYLVNVTEDVYVYTFGESGYEQFGAHPGKKLSEIASKENVTGDLHFQDRNVDVWTIDLNIGYPTADHLILTYMNEHGYVGSQSADMLLVPYSAYWFSDDVDYHNDDAGAALDFLRYAEEYRLAAVDESICNLDTNQAKSIVNRYNNLTQTQRETYVDATTVLTYRPSLEAGKEYVSYRLVMEQISIIAGIDLEGSERSVSSPIVNAATTDATTLIAIVAIVAIISISSVAVLLVIKKRKHQ